MAALALIGLAGGCQSYEAQPIDAAAHRAEFLARTASAPAVAEYARTLAAASPDAPLVFEPSDGLSLAESEAVALVFNRDLRLARLRAGVSAAEAEFAGLWEDPVLGTDIVRIIESAENPWKLFAMVGFTLPISGRLEIEKARATEAHRADIVRTWGQEWATRAELKQRWVEWSAARERVAVERVFVEQLDRIVGLVNQIAETGEMTRVESRLFKIELASRLAELAALESQASRLELAVKSLLGLPPSATTQLVPALVLASGHDVMSTDWVEPSDRNTDLAVARVDYAVAERSLELEIRKQYPDLTISPGYGREDGQDQFLLGLSLPLPMLNRNQQGIATARAERELSRAVYEATYEQVASELAAASIQYQAAVRQRELLEREILPLVDAQYAEAQRIAELGEVDSLVMLESLSRQQDARVRLIEARAAETLAFIRLQELVGPANEPPAVPSETQGAQP